MIARRFLSFLGLIATLAIVACADIHGTIPARVVPTAGSCPAFVAGAATSELTPPPGFALGGFSISGRMARGRWTPLKARAIYMQDASCRSLVLVSTDLMIMPNGLADRVADLLAKKEATRHIGRENMLLTATENHLSPGNYFTSKLYNGYSSHVAGFNETLFDYLSQQITRAVRDAIANQKKAILRTGSGNIPDFFRNRALPAFLRNREAFDFLSQASSTGASACPPLPYGAHPLASHEYFHELACLAVVPKIDVIELVRASDKSRIALAGFLATHTTVLPSSIEAYSADLLGVTALRMERGELPTDCAADGDFPVVALFNGAQGDVSTQWSTRDRGDLLDLSDRIAQKLCAALPASEDTTPTLAFRYREVEPLTDVSFDDPFDGQKYQHKTPDEPDAGAPELGGASDGRTIFYELAHREELTTFRRTQHGSKAAPLSLDIGFMRVPFGTWEFRGKPPPKAAPLTVMKVGPKVLVGVPGEMTTMMGARTRRLIAKQHGIDPEELVIVGFGNGHVSYFPTTEEYDAQWYEGASDYYGPGTGSYLATQLSELAGALAGDPTKLPERDYGYKVGGKTDFEARHVGHPAYHPDDGLTRLVDQLELVRTTSGTDPPNPILAATEEPRISKRDYPTFCFIDALPRLENVLDSADDECRRNFPEVSIREAGAPNVVEIAGRKQNNGGTELITILSTAGEDRAEWCAVWMAPHELDGEGLPTNRDTKYEFHVRGITQTEGENLTPSAPFTLNGGFDQTHVRSLTCDEFTSDDMTAVGGIFTERATCEPLERPGCTELFWPFCALSMEYCELPETGS